MDLDIIYRDLAATPLAHLSGSHLAAGQGAPIEDPTLLAKPFTLEYTYNRAEPHTYAFGDFCDPHEDNGRTVSDGE